MTPNGKPKIASHGSHHVPGLPSGYPSNDQNLASIMASLQMGGQNPQAGPPALQVDPSYSAAAPSRGLTQPPTGYSPATDPFNPFGMRSPDNSSPRNGLRRNPSSHSPAGMPPHMQYGTQSPQMTHSPILGLGQPTYGGMPPPPPPQQVPPHVYQAYMYQAYQQNPNMGPFHA
jgi:protein JSN1